MFPTRNKMSNITFDDAVVALDFKAKELQRASQAHKEAAQIQASEGDFSYSEWLSFLALALEDAAWKIKNKLKN